MKTRELSLRLALVTVLFFSVSCSRDQTTAQAEKQPQTQAAAAEAETREQPATTAATAGSPDKVIVYYFHGTYRCRACTLLEEYADAAIKEFFGEELKDGKLEWKSVNVEEKGNEHFVGHYQIFSRHLIVSALKDGQEIKWKDCKQIWHKLRNPLDYKEYVQTEVRNYLEGVWESQES
jgi:hypothetical protein